MRTTRLDTLDSYCFLFLRIRYDKNDYQSFLSAHSSEEIITALRQLSKNPETTSVFTHRDKK